MGTSQHPTQWLPEAITLRVKYTGPEADNSSFEPSSRIGGAIPPLPNTPLRRAQTTLLLILSNHDCGPSVIRRFVLIKSCLTYQQSSKTPLLLLMPIFAHSLEWQLSRCPGTGQIFFSYTLIVRNLISKCSGTKFCTPFYAKDPIGNSG